jgi:hypothetical protein
MIRYFHCKECGFETTSDDEHVQHGGTHSEIYEENPYLLVAHGDSHYNRDWARTVGKRVFNVAPDLTEDSLIKTWAEALVDYDDVEVYVFYRGVRVYDGGYCMTESIKPVFEKVKTVVAARNAEIEGRETAKKNTENALQEQKRREAELATLAQLKSKYEPKL